MTTVIPYQATKKQDGYGTNLVSLHSITAHPQYEDKSFEELRLLDHNTGRGNINNISTGMSESSGHAFASSPGGNDKGVKENNDSNANKRPTPKQPSAFGFPVPAPSSISTAPSTGGFSFSLGSTTSPTGAKAPSSTTKSLFGSAPLAPSISSSGFSFGAPTTPSLNAAISSVDKSPPRAKRVNRVSLKNKASDSSLEGYEQFREFMDKLAESGVDDYVDLPMIAVMGDTSSGKSSLLSNISLVELPSSDTLTTRCPIRLQMRNAKTRTACVKVVWKDKPEKGDADFAERTVGEENWNDITDIIAEAQAHIIEKSGKDVARDIVCVDMKGPHCENLTLIDLPGIVRSTGKGESFTLAEDIQALMHDYLNNERCVILAVHPCNVDFHNSQILAEAKKVDPQTKRTIPVLTKPDLIDDGAESNVKDLLLGKKTDTFELGFHMIKGRGQKDLNEDVDIEDGLTKEEAFFRNKEPWRSIEDKKFGTKNLRVKLAKLQMDLIRESFKSIISEMKDRRDEAALELKSLGDIPSTLKDKRTLFRKVREEIREGLGTESLSGRTSKLNSDNAMRPSAEFILASKMFQQKLNSSKLANISSIEVGTLVIAIVNGNEVQDKVSFVDKENNVYLTDHARVKTKGWTKLSPGMVFRSENDVFSAKIDGTFHEIRPISRKLVRNDPRWISELIEKNRPYNLPIFPNPNVFDAIVADQIAREWENPSMELLGFTATLMENTSQCFIEDITMIKSLPSLTEYLVQKSSEVIETIKQDTEKELLKYIEREKTPYTQNHYLFENLSKLRTQQLKDEVLDSVLIHRSGGEVDADKLTSAIQNIFERNQKRSIDDHMAEEMQNALDAYGKVAFKRFEDAVPMICDQIIKRFPKMINDILSDVLDSEIEQLVVAPPGAIANMNALKKEVETLDKGIDTVKGLSKSGVDV